MRLSTTAVLAALCSAALAQNLLDQLPKCARDCFGNSFGNCAPLDIPCICGNQTRIAALSCCVSQTCEDKDEENTIKFARDICSANGITVPTQASCAASQTGAPSTAPPSSAATSGASTAASSAASSGAPQSSAATAATQSPGAAPTPLVAKGIGMGLVAVAGGLLAAL
ncbi:hypothetical protein BU24DRAFT_462201 [Aaosphaeria arxii CBS 175.79]|uniref:CFEM domain-containing protein n=1 Tax=Aaosphaeria arxii CBS 175.79 TaxID=1450172 RepID=A0A6A5XSV7_9PLEO|nr:uncharacterized protein BU24DRAFT_462201 [Aaosphaeria arxii CBS 175.79]KAF2015989.1 hypothetical protein BU24DRAFT_462201 [Aaosphaeria arxii CBS 175.79]